ncbi:MAG: amidohydrolase family protein [Proteobacteria bacterium]|nr:amidohydrolase family protein [Pseudomonadota bacterium]
MSNPYYKPHPTRPVHSPDYRGYPYLPVEELKELVTGIHKKGWQLAIHSNSDAASEDAINALEAALKALPRHDHRHVLIHNQFAREDQLDRIRQLGLVPSFMITNNYYLGHLYRDLVLGPFRAERANPAGSAWRRGLPFTGHNDAFVTPIRPLLTIYEAATRLTASGDVLGEHQKVPVAEAVRSVTSHATFQAFEEKIKGSIEPGKLTDFVVVDRVVGALDLARQAEPADLPAIARANQYCNLMGMDTISAGGVIAFAMECFEEGVISEADTEGRAIRFGDIDIMLELLEDIAGWLRTFPGDIDTPRT